MSTQDIVINVPRVELRPSPLNQRKHFDGAELSRLAQNIRAEGIINPLVVRPAAPTPDFPAAKYEIIAGERRWRGSSEMSHPDTGAILPALDTVPIIVREVSDATMIELMLSENMQRRDLTELEESAAFIQAMEATDADGKPLYASAIALADKIGVSSGYIYQRLALRKLPKEARKALAEGKISFRVARVICACPASVIEQASDMILHPGKHSIYSAGDGKEPLSAEEAQEMLSYKVMKDLADAPFKLTDAHLLPVATDPDGERLDGGACSDCPWNTANQGNDELAPKGRGHRVEKRCLNPACYARKVEILTAAAMVEAKEKQWTVIEGKEAEKAVGYRSHYVDLDQKPDFDDRSQKIDERKLPTWRKLAVSEETQPKITVAILPSGKVAHLLDRQVAIAAVQQNGKEEFLSASAGRGKSAQGEDYAAQQRKEREEAKLRNEISMAVMEELMGEIALGGKLPGGFMGWLADVAIEAAGMDGWQYAAKRREQGSVSDAAAYIRKLREDSQGNDTLLLSLAVEMLVAREVKYSGINSAKFKAVCEIWDVHPASHDKMIRAAHVQAAKEADAKKKAKAGKAEKPAAADPEAPKTKTGKEKGRLAGLRYRLHRLTEAMKFNLDTVNAICTDAVGKSYDAIGNDPELLEKVIAVMEEMQLPQDKVQKAAAVTTSAPTLEERMQEWDPYVLDDAREMKQERGESCTVSTFEMAFDLDRDRAARLLDLVIDLAPGKPRTVGEFEWNEHGICTNPHKREIKLPKKQGIKILTAFDGRQWRAAHDVSFTVGGFGMGVSDHGVAGRPTQLEAELTEAQEVFQRISDDPHASKQMIQGIQTLISKLSDQLNEASI